MPDADGSAGDVSVADQVREQEREKKKAKEAKQEKAELEDLQVKSLFSLIKEVNIKGLNSKLIYMTNRQARNIDLKKMSKFIFAMDLDPKPKLVINFFESFASIGHNAYDYCHFSYRQGDIDGDPSVAHGEPDGEKGLAETERRIGEFMKSCILPIAIKSNAIVLLGADHCSFSRIFSALCAREAAKYNGRLPFYTLCVVDAMTIHENTKVGGTIANALLRASPRWKKAAPRMEGLMMAGYGAPAKNRYCLTFCPPATHYFVVEAIDEDATGQTDGKLETLPTKALRAYVTSRFAETLPSLGFAAFAAKDGFDQMQRFSRYTARGLPLFLVDTTAPPNKKGGGPPTEGLAAVGDDVPWLKGADEEDRVWLRAAASELMRRDAAIAAAPGGYNCYHAGTVSYLYDTLQAQLKKEFGGGGSRRGGDAPTKGQYICDVVAAHNAAVKARREGAEAQADAFRENVKRCVDLVVWLDERRAEAYGAKLAKFRAAEVASFARDVDRAVDVAAVNGVLETWFLKWCGTLVRKAPDAALGREGRVGAFVAAAPALFATREIAKGPHGTFAEVPQVVGGSLDDVKAACAAFQEQQRPAALPPLDDAGGDANGSSPRTPPLSPLARSSSKLPLGVLPAKLFEANTWSLETYSALSDVLSSEHTYAGSLADPSVEINHWFGPPPKLQNSLSRSNRSRFG